MSVWLAVMALLAAGLAVLTTGTAMVAGAADGTRQLPSGGTTTIRALATGSDAVQFPEFAFDPDEGEDEEEDLAAAADTVVNRSLTRGAGTGEVVAGARKAKSRPELVTSFDGLNHRDQRLANNGNQFSIEPPDQGLCVGNGFVLETVNDVLRVYDTAGNALVGVADQNTFYGYAPAIDRTTGLRGQFVTDPSCIFDADAQRWFHVVLTLEVNPTTGAFLGPNHLDLAVSNTASPLGSWTIYRLPVQDDGTQGTPNHGCSLGPCIGDYPHIGADASGFYITTNEYSLNGPEFIAAQLYAFPKAQLAANAATVPVVQFDTRGLVAGNPGFTVWPAVSPRGQYEFGAGGTEYFLSSMAAEEANGDGSDDRIALWALTNTRSLNSATPNLTLRNTILPVRTYAEPPKADQKPGDIPLGQCVNDTTLPTPAGPGCWRLLLAAEPAHNEVESRLDSNDTRMQQVTFANGKVWGALDSAVTVGGESKAGIGWYVVKPHVTSAGVSGVVAKQGLLGVARNHVTYPAIGVLPNGRGVMAFTLVGADHYPSAAYAPIDALAGVGDVRVAAEGRGPSDGFTSYKAFVGNPPRTRWGDYGAAAVDGKSIWIASEYIAQTCTFAEYVSGAVGSCGGTRTALGNWGTRISRLNF
jgi:hypothetical protein